jgi:hypothetical protein
VVDEGDLKPEMTATQAARVIQHHFRLYLLRTKVFMKTIREKESSKKSKKIGIKRYHSNENLGVSGPSLEGVRVANDQKLTGVQA